MFSRHLISDDLDLWQQVVVIINCSGSLMGNQQYSDCEDKNKKPVCYRSTEQLIITDMFLIC